MNITFLVGNGFDLNLGLKTKYEDFLRIYADKSKATQYLIDNDPISKFKYNVLKDFDAWSNAEEAFGEYTFKYITKINGADEFCDCHEDFCLRLAEYLNDQQQSFDVKSQKEKISKKFAASISFDIFIYNFREVQKQQLQNSAKLISGAYNYNFINFNYTTTLDKCVDCVRENSKILGIRKIDERISYTNKIEEIIHVHGYTDRDMVLGVNDTSQIKSLQLFNGYGDEYLNQFIKQKTNEMNEENIDEKTYDLLKRSDLIYIYGMSIGKTDALWWQRIIQIMLNRKNVHTIIHCFERPSNSLLRRKIQTFDKEKKLEFLSYSDISEDQKDDIMNRIHIDGKNIFAALKDMAANTSIDSSVEQQEEKVLVNV